MKYLFLLLISVNCFASSAWFPIGKEDANTNYFQQSVCEEKEGQVCYDIGECPLDECILIDEIDDIGFYTGKKLLRNSPVRKLEKEEAIQAEIVAKLEAIEKKKASKVLVESFEFKGKTIAELKAELNIFTNEVKELLKE